MRRAPRGLGRLARDARLLTGQFARNGPNQAGKIASTIPTWASSLRPNLSRRWAGADEGAAVVAALVLVAGGIAFLIAYFGNTAEVKHPGTRAGPAQDNSGKTPATCRSRRTPRASRPNMSSATMTRQNMALSWKLTHPELKNGYTYKQWLSGDIPVPVFPAERLRGASYKVQWSHPNDVLLDVYVFAKPKQGDAVTGVLHRVEARRDRGQQALARFLRRSERRRSEHPATRVRGLEPHVSLVGVRGFLSSPRRRRRALTVTA